MEIWNFYSCKLNGGLFVDKADNVFITDDLTQLRSKLKYAGKDIEGVSRVYTRYGNSSDDLFNFLDPCIVHIQDKEPRHDISNNVAFSQVQTQTSMCSLLFSLETHNDVQSVAQHQ